MGQQILLKLVAEHGYDISDRHLDCGMLIFDPRARIPMWRQRLRMQCSITGGLSAAENKSGEWQRILFVPTGALLSTVKL